MAGPRLIAVMLHAFKSFHEQRFDLHPLSIVIGRNSSGKSNLFDALDVLKRLAVQPVLSEALDSRHLELRPVRGGSRGLAPFDSSSFVIGCEVACDTGTLHYEIEVSVEGRLHVVRESLARVNDLIVETLFTAQKNLQSQSTISVTIPSDAPGVSQTHELRDSATVLSQIESPLLSYADEMHRILLPSIHDVEAALKGVFSLDPVPHLMRGYVNEHDTELRQHGENISAAVAHLRDHSAESFAKLVDAVNTVADGNVVDLQVVKSEPLNDVIVSLVEDYASRSGDTLTPASQMSDGLLRFLAIAVAMLQPPTGDGIPGAKAPRITVIEEIENGLHPSQAKLVLELIHESNKLNPDSSVIVSTHSPALLTACEGRLLQNVVLCSRSSDTGLSGLERLVDAPGYPAAMAQGTAGEMMTNQSLYTQPRPDVDAFLAELGEQ